MTQSEYLSDLLYCAAMGPLPDSRIAEACAVLSIPFPPRLAPVRADEFPSMRRLVRELTADPLAGDDLVVAEEVAA